MSLPPGLQLPPSFPPGVDPTTYKIAEVTKLLEAADYFPIFNIPSPASKNQPVPVPLPLLSAIPQLMTAVNVNEQLHRFEVVVVPPTRQRGLTAINRVGEPVGRVQIRWTPMPDDYDAGPNVLPPPTILNPFVSQRFCMLNGALDFDDPKGSGIRAFGCGRTFPAGAGAAGKLYIGAAIDVIEGLGELCGLPGATFPGATMVVNGFIQPPDNLRLNLMVRVMDPGGLLRATPPLPPLVPAPAGADDPTAVFFYFLGAPDPKRPVQLILGPNGMPVGSHVFENLHLVHLACDVSAPAGLRSVVDQGPVIGTVAATLWFNFLDPRPVFPIQTTDGVFTFFDPDGAPLGTVLSNMVEGRAFRTNLPGAPMPVFRFGGLGPLLGGSGEFANAAGMMTMNSVISVFPRTLSNLYMLRIEDPTGRLRARLGGALG